LEQVIAVRIFPERRSVREMPDGLKQPWMFPATEGQAKAAMAVLGLVVASVIGWLVIYGPGFRAVHAAVSE